MLYSNTISTMCAIFHGGNAANKPAVNGLTTLFSQKIPKDQIETPLVYKAPILHFSFQSS